jgi:hypothetical protein
VFSNLEFNVKVTLAKEHDAFCNVLPMKKALQRVDEIWDGIFEYN